jgi:cytochrome c biogenesis protein CcmG/thiol:disulfide interchange protein DsbE
MPARQNILLGLATVFAILGVSAAVAAFHFFNPPANEPLIAPDARQPAAIAHPTLTGEPFRSDAHKGHVLLINYFATWCPPCNAEIPDLLQIAAEYKPKGVEAAAISVDAPDNKRHDLLAAFAQSHNLTFPILVPAADAAIFRADMSIPQTFLIDKQGRTAYHVVGQIDPVDLREKLDRLLAEP